MYLSCVTQVVTEKVRLTDDEAMSAQTTVDGDLYQWFKHQASQGDVSAQVGVTERRQRAGRRHKPLFSLSCCPIE